MVIARLFREDWYWDLKARDIITIFKSAHESIANNPETTLNDITAIVRDILPDLESELQDRLAFRVFILESLSYEHQGA